MATRDARIGLQRAANETTQVGSYRIPQGTRVWLNALAIHRDERHYPQPEVRPRVQLFESCKLQNRDLRPATTRESKPASASQ